MIFNPETRKAIFIVIAFLLFLAALYHFAGLFYKVDNSPGWRHLLFVEINLFCVYGFVKRPRYFVWLFTILLVHQYYSHGLYLTDLWIDKKQIHWIS